MDAAARDEVLGSRGSLRMGYLKEFLVMRLKESGQLKRETVDEVHASDSRTEKEFHEWTLGGHVQGDDERGRRGNQESAYGIILWP